MLKTYSQLLSPLGTKKKVKTILPPSLLKPLGDFIKSLCRATSRVLFLDGAVPGALLLITMLIQPAVLFMGFVGVLGALFFAQIIKLENFYWDRPPYLFNPLLAGLGIGFVFKLSLSSIFLTFITGILTFILTWALSNVLYNLFYLPVLSIPFALVSWLIRLASYHYFSLQLTPYKVYLYSIGLPIPLEGFLRALGSIFFMPNIVVGALALILLAVNSRIHLVLAIEGYFIGTAFKGLLAGNFNYVYYDPGAYNFILVAIAIGGYFLIPSVRSYLISAIGVLLTVIIGEAIVVFWTGVALPVESIPYNLVTMLIIYCLGLAKNPSLAKYPQLIPEKTLERELSNRLRYRYTNSNGINLPFTGCWIVWQGIDGEFTHKGVWRYAFDFIIEDEEGYSFTNNGLKLEDYYAYNKPVFSPVTGWVITVVNYLDDCPIGTIDQENNWGNYIVIYDEKGFYVEISHFLQNSILAKQGDFIEKGTFIGRCGNSGYSSQPHIHIQLQLTPEIGSATIPLNFINIKVDGKFHSEYIPLPNSKVEPIQSHNSLSQIMPFPLNRQFNFVGLQKGVAVANLNFIVKVSSYGEYFLDSGKAQLFFHRNENIFMFDRIDGKDPWLSMLMIAIPKLPLVDTKTWQDSLPLSLVDHNITTNLYQFLSSIFPNFSSACYEGQWVSNNSISGFISLPYFKKKKKSSVKFDNKGNIIFVNFNKRSLIAETTDLH